MSNKRDNYKAWLINPEDFPYKDGLERQIAFLTGYGVLAPSMHNTQPWVLEIEYNQLTIKPNGERLLNIGDPNKQGIYIALGAFAENIVQAAKAFGLKTVMRVDDGIIKLTFTGNPMKPNNTKAFDNITGRLSSKLTYIDKTLSKSVKSQLKNLNEEGIKIEIIEHGKKFEELVNNHLKAASSIAKIPEFAQELAEWLRSNDTKAADGMPGFVTGMPSLKARIGKVLISKKPTLLQKLALKDRDLLESSSAILVVSIAGHINPSKSAKTGQIIERVWLKLTELGLSAHPMYASIQEPKALKRLAEIVGTQSTPLFFMRIGYGRNKQTRHTPRRGLYGNDLQNSLSEMANALKSHPISHSIRVGKYDINYVTAGQGKPVLLIHGANIGWPQWHLNIDALAQHFKIYALDLPGAGGSSKVTFSKTDFEADYLNVVDLFVKKLGLKKLDVVGSSFGGWVAMRMAIEHKPYLNKLVVTNPIGFTKHMPIKFRPVSLKPFAVMLTKTALKPSRSNKNLEKFMRDVFYNKNLLLAPEFIDYFYELSKESHNLLFISRLAHYSGMRQELYLGNDLGKVAVPSLIIWGKQDPLMPFHTVKPEFKKFKDANIEILENVGHMPPVEAAPRFNKLVTKFLSG